MDGWIEDAKSDKWNAIQTILHEWRLACLTMDLPDNDVISDDSSTVDRGLGVSYRQMWDHDRFRGRPALRWLSDVFVRQLLGAPEGGAPNKMVIFAPLPGQVSYVKWFRRTFHSDIHSI